MTQTLYGIYGIGGCGRGIMPLAREMLHQHDAKSHELVFIDDGGTATAVNGHRVLSYDAFCTHPARAKHAAIAIANGETRARLAAKLDADGVAPWTVSAANAVIMDDVTVAGGALISPFVTFTSNIKIGRHFHANLYSYVEHDCVIGDFVTFAPGVHCNGNIHIEDFVYVGTGAVIRQGLPGKPLVIGRGATIGMGAVVTKNVPPGMTVVGNPARELIKSRPST